MQPLPFAEALALAHTLRLVDRTEWGLWCKNDYRPASLPTDPDRVYTHRGLRGWAHWLNLKPAPRTATRFPPFDEALAVAQSLGLASAVEWQRWCKEGMCPRNVPSRPGRTYKGGGWQGWGHWLGTGNQPGRQQATHFLPFAEALVVVRSLGRPSRDEWRAWSKSGARPANVPANPHQIYVDHGWQGMRHWLGTTPGGSGGGRARTPSSSGDPPRSHKRPRIPPPPSTDDARAPGGGGGKRARMGLTLPRGAPPRARQGRNSSSDTRPPVTTVVVLHENDRVNNNKCRPSSSSMIAILYGADLAPARKVVLVHVALVSSRFRPARQSGNHIRA